MHASLALAHTEIVVDLKFLYADPRGRISRKTWWLGIVGLIVIAIIVQIPLSIVASLFRMSQTPFGLGLMALIATAILFVPYYSITLKRLHDRSRPAMLFWVFFAPSVISAILMMLGVSGSMGTLQMFGKEAPFFKPNAIGQGLNLISTVIGIWALVELGFLKGQAGDNAYGTDPLARRR